MIILTCFVFCFIAPSILPLIRSCGEAHCETSDKVFKIEVRTYAGVFLTALAEREGDIAKKF